MIELTRRNAELTEALSLAIDVLESFYGSDADDSKTVEHLRSVLKGS